jgi:hypothetical protein
MISKRANFPSSWSANKSYPRIGVGRDHLHHILQKTTLPNRAAIAAACKGPLDDA